MSPRRLDACFLRRKYAYAPEFETELTSLLWPRDDNNSGALVPLPMTDAYPGEIWLRGAKSTVGSYADLMVLHGRKFVYANRVAFSTSQNGLSRVLALETVGSQLLVSDLLLLFLLGLLLLV